MQSKRMSVIETFVNTLIGLCIAFIAQLVIFRCYGIHTTMATNAGKIMYRFDKGTLQIRHVDVLNATKEFVTYRGDPQHNETRLVTAGVVTSTALFFPTREEAVKGAVQYLALLETSYADHIVRIQTHKLKFQEQL